MCQNIVYLWCLVVFKIYVHGMNWVFILNAGYWVRKIWKSCCKTCSSQRSFGCSHRPEWEFGLVRGVAIYLFSFMYIHAYLLIKHICIYTGNIFNFQEWNFSLVLLQQDPLFEMHSGDLRTILGHCDGELLKSADRVIVSPGVPLDNYGISSLWHSVSIQSNISQRITVNW